MFDESFPSPTQVETDEACQRVFLRLTFGAAPAGTAPSLASAYTSGRPVRLAPVAAAVGMVLLLSFVVTRMFMQSPTLSANVENEDGTTFRLVAGDVLRTDAWTLRKLTLPDGSRIEMRSRTELALQNASAGVRIQLAKGSVLVRAAKQAAGHLYVETKDVEVSVIGTVFLVAVEEAGSRVAVLEGQVRVKQGAVAKDLVVGEELVTNPQMESLSPESTKQVEQPVETKQQQTRLQPVQPNQPPQAAARPQFEVASVKRNNSGGDENFFTGSVGRFKAVNMPLRLLMQVAYKVEDFQIVGAPGWIDTEHYDIEGTAEGAAGMNEMNGPMLQALIEDRFKAAVHGETRDMLVYFLTVAKNGSKLTTGPCVRREQPNTPVPPGQRESICGYMGIGPGMLRSTSNRLQRLTDALSGILKRKVLDRTGLTGEFDINLKWAPDPAVDPGPAIFTAIEEQLGLKLESGKAPIDVLVIDRIERPTEN